MRIFIFSIILIALSECGSQTSANHDQEKQNNIVKGKQICNPADDSLLLKYGNEFTPTDLELDSSLSFDLKKYLSKVDTSCLRKVSNYRYFISMVLAKLYLYHLKCCDQSYDLYQMKTGEAAIIINEYDKVSGYNSQNLEMLSSGTIVEFINNDKILSANPSVHAQLNKIKLEEDRLRRGIQFTKGSRTGKD